MAPAAADPGLSLPAASGAKDQGPTTPDQEGDFGQDDFRVPVRWLENRRFRDRARAGAALSRLNTSFPIHPP